MRQPIPPRWCCRVFQEHCSRSSRGVGVSLEDYGNRWRFVIKSRLVDDGVELHRVVTEPVVPIAIDSQIIISYCPWCGAHLRDVYGALIGD